MNVAGVRIDRVPQGGLRPGGFAVSWGGRF
jgi:hypothetical protein